MSVIGIDLGNHTCLVATARGNSHKQLLRGLNSTQETSNIICFGDKQRFLGTADPESSTISPENTISLIKTLIGRQFSDPELQRTIKTLPFSVTEGANGYPLINARYMGESRAFTPTQVLGMLLSQLKILAEKKLNAAVVDCSIGIPVYFTNLQRRAVIDAAKIAGLDVLCLFHETTAAALAYGIYHPDLPKDDPINIAFVDIGHVSMQVCIAAFKKGQVKILAHASDQSLGGRDFDEALFQHFAAKFNDEYKIDVHQNTGACIKLRAACEKLKKDLSANPEASLNIESLMDGKDVRGFIKRDDFEQISNPILERVRKPLEKALKEARLNVKNIRSVEAVGLGSQVPAVFKILSDFFLKEPIRRMKESGRVAKGCALQCASLGQKNNLIEFEVYENFPFPIALSWKVLASENQTVAGDNKQSAEVFPKGSSIPSVEIFTFLGSNTFTLDVQYADPAELQAPAKISSYTIGHFQAENNKRALMNVKTRLDIHGIVSVVSATLLEEYETDVVPEPNQMGIVAKVETSDKKAMKRILPLFEDDVYRGLTDADLEKAVKEELTMLEMLETKHKKCVLEAYVSETLEKDANTNCEFFADHEREKLVEILNDAKDWLCEDGKDKTKRDYIVKLKNLKKTCNPILTRYTEHTKRECVISKLSDDINNYKVAAESTTDPKFVHIDLAEKQNSEEVEAWLKEKKQQQDELPKHATQILSSCDVKERAEALATFYMSVMMKPKPTEKPATAPVPPSLATTEGGEPESEGPHNNYEVDENIIFLFSKISGVEDPVTFWKGTSKLLVYIQENKDTYPNSQSCPFYEKYMEVLDCLAHNDEGSATCLSYCAAEELIEAVGNKIYNMQDHDYIILVVAGLLCIRHGFFNMGIFFFKNIKDLESSSNLLKHNVLKCSSDMPPKLVSLCTDEIERWIVELLRFWSFWMFGVNASDAKIVDEVILEREKTYFSGLAKTDGLEKEYSIHKKSVMYNIKKYEFFNLILLVKKHGLKIESGRRHAFKPTIKDRDIVTTKLKSLKAELSKLTTSDLGVYGFLISFTSGALFHLFRYNDDAKESLKKAKEVIEEQLNPFKRFFLQNSLNNLDSHFQNQIKPYTEEELDELDKEPKQTKLTKQAKKAQKAKEGKAKKKTIGEKCYSDRGNNEKRRDASGKRGNTQQSTRDYQYTEIPIRRRPENY